ncbi:MAG: M56 family metallopeptidase [Saprospiraceae bacterium]|nr:M56 family metallopeptidase [Saprospiraceae bacterium]
MFSIQYILESAFCLACLYALYWLFLRRETFFQWNRAYLLLAPLVACMLPALHIRLEQPAPVPAAVVPVAPALDLPVLIEQAQRAPRAVGQSLHQSVGGISLGEVLWWVYLLGLILFLLHLAVQLFRMARFIRQCRRVAQGGVVLATGPAETPLASFFGFVFWHPGTVDEREQRLMFEHEMVHVRQWHSLDVLLIELMIAMQWFNPLLYMYRRSLRTVHEYIADAYVVSRTRQRLSYAQLLADQITGKRAQPVLVNTFHSLIQNRLIMLAKSPSGPLRRAKYLFTLPLFAALMLLFSFRLVERLPEAAPLRAALQQAETFAEQLSTVAITPAQAPALSEPTPYIFYWGSLQGKLFREEGSQHYVAEIHTTPEELRRAIDREPRLWNGQSLEQTLLFSLDKLSVRSDYYDPKVYDSFRAKLSEQFAGLEFGQTLTLHDIPMPQQATATILLMLDGARPGWLPKPITGDTARPKSTVLMRAEWGGKTFTDHDKAFITLSQLRALVQQKPTLYYLDGGSRTPEKLSMSIFQKGIPLVKSLSEKAAANGVALDMLPALLEQHQALLQPEAVVDFSYEMVHYPVVPAERVDTIITFNPETYQEKTEIRTQTFAERIELNPLIVRFHLVPDNDPRLELRASDKSDFRLDWTPLYSNGFLQRYGQSIVVDPTKPAISADNAIETTNFMLTASDILGMVREPARLFRNNKPVEHFEFVLRYRNTETLVTDGQLPASLVRTLERNLKARDTLVITGIRSATFDLSNVTMNLEIRSEDPKPPLRSRFNSRKTAPDKPAGIGLSVSPNPAQEQATVTFDLPKEGWGLFTVTDAQGMEHYSLKTDFHVGETPFRLPLDQIKARGTLFLRLEMPYGNAVAKLIVE